MSATEYKSWKKINEERKLLKRKHKQEKLLKQIEKVKKLDATETEIIPGNELFDQKKSNSTLSIAVPGSILENAQSAELRTYLAGQIARAACIFRVDEIIIFDDIGVHNAKQTKGNKLDSDDKNVHSSCLQLARILQYLECPQYLRKFFFPLHNDLKYSGLLNPLDAPHHLRKQNLFMYREGIVIEKKTKVQNNCFVNVGLQNEVLVNKSLSPGIRVTVKIDNYNDEQSNKKLKGTVVAPNEPRNKTGIYWGYSVRVAHSTSEIFTKSPYDKGYDLSIGTSDKGTNVYDVEKNSLNYIHGLIVFGGLKGLEFALDNDEELNVEDPKLLFDHYFNVVPIQGSRTIRTEESLLIALSIMQEKLNPNVPDIEFMYKDCVAQSEDTGIKILNNNNSKMNADLSRFD